MSLFSKDTKWVFICPAIGTAEPRHIYDIALGISFLLKRKIEHQDIVVIIDGTTPDIVNKIFSEFGIPTCFVILKTKDYFGLYRSNIHKNTVIFVTGHGGLEGMASEYGMKPVPFYDELKQAPNLENAVVFFGQCEAGVYNYVSLDTSKTNNCHIVAVGGADLQSSLSTPVIIPDGKWEANVFLAKVFQWIAKPIDVDGDDCFSVMDAFKFASMTTQEICKDLEQEYNRAIELKTYAEFDRLKEIKEILKTRELSEDEKLELQSLNMSLKKEKLNQMPWILNAFAAIEMKF